MQKCNEKLRPTMPPDAKGDSATPLASKAMYCAPRQKVLASGNELGAAPRSLPVKAMPKKRELPQADTAVTSACGKKSCPTTASVVPCKAMPDALRKSRASNVPSSSSKDGPESNAGDTPAKIKFSVDLDPDL